MVPPMLVRRAEWGYMQSMSTIIPIAIFVTLLAVVGVLLVGVFAMARGGEFNRKYGNKLMQARVALQAVAVALLFLLWLAFGK